MLVQLAKVKQYNHKGWRVKVCSKVTEMTRLCTDPRRPLWRTHAWKLSGRLCLSNGLSGNCIIPSKHVWSMWWGWSSNEPTSVPFRTSLKYVGSRSNLLKNVYGTRELRLQLVSWLWTIYFDPLGPGGSMWCCSIMLKSQKQNKRILAH